VTAPFPLIEIAGPPQQRGFDYGRQAGGRIEAGLRLYRDEFARRSTPWPEALKFGAGLAPAVERYAPDLMQEIAGIARGADQPVEAIIVLNARTEILYASHFSPEAAHRPHSGDDLGLLDECTSALALPEVTADRQLIHGQNWDWRPECVDTTVVLKIHSDDGPDILTFTEAGQLARHGLNSAGVSITANGLHCDQDAGRIGVPTPIIRRRMLMQQNLAGAFGVLLAAERSGSHNLTIGHAGGEALGLEATPSEIFWLRPDRGILTHANHFKSPVAMVKVKELGLLTCPESIYRDSRVEDRLRHDASSITIASFKNAFADDYGAPDSVCRLPAMRRTGLVSATVATLIMSRTAMLIAPQPYLGKHYSEYHLG
jgi:isopenicillin-N N-acyltransferase like protein